MRLPSQAVIRWSAASGEHPWVTRVRMPTLLANATPDMPPDKVSLAICGSGGESPLARPPKR